MGRWSQRTRSGGGASLNFIVTAVHDDPETMLLTYLNNVNASLFAPGLFTSSPSTEQSISVSQQGAKVLQVTFNVDVSADTEVIYQGTVPSVLSPQSIAVS